MEIRYGGHMQTRKLPFLTATALFATVAVSTGLGQVEQQKIETRKYYVIDLGDPLGVPSAAAASINNIGWIAGNASATATTEHAELWVGVPLDLGTLGGPNSAVAWPNKNNQGQIVGITETADVNLLGEDWSCALANFPTITHHICYGFLWQDGVMTMVQASTAAVRQWDGRRTGFTIPPALRRKSCSLRP
jgi:uncharacterized membrane protein